MRPATPPGGQPRPCQHRTPLQSRPPQIQVTRVSALPASLTLVSAESQADRDSPGRRGKKSWRDSSAEMADSTSQPRLGTPLSLWSQLCPREGHLSARSLSPAVVHIARWLPDSLSRTASPQHTQLSQRPSVCFKVLPICWRSEGESCHHGPSKEAHWCPQHIFPVQTPLR